MSTLVIFSALIYLVNALGLQAPTGRVITVVLAAVGIICFLLRCFGVALPACLVT